MTINDRDLSPEAEEVLLALAAVCVPGEDETTGAFVLRAIGEVLKQRNTARTALDATNAERWKASAILADAVGETHGLKGPNLVMLAEKAAQKLETGGTWALAAELDQTRRERDEIGTELARWKDAEAHRGYALAAVARERDAYGEEAEHLDAAVRDVREPGESTLQAVQRLVTERKEG